MSTANMIDWTWPSSIAALFGVSGTAMSAADAAVSLDCSLSRSSGIPFVYQKAIAFLVFLGVRFLWLSWV